MTNNHVIEGADRIEVSLEMERKRPAELVLHCDTFSDLAVLKIDAKHVDTFLEFGDSDKLRAGDPVVAIGNPLGSISREPLHKELLVHPPAQLK